MDNKTFELIIQTYYIAADEGDTELMSAAREGLISIINNETCSPVVSSDVPDKMIQEALDNLGKGVSDNE